MSDMVDLPGVGLYPGIPASELRAGMVLVWAYGTTAKVISRQVRGRFIEVVEEYDNGERFVRLFDHNRRVVTWHTLLQADIDHGEEQAWWLSRS
jgi:hypothetical protein